MVKNFFASNGDPKFDFGKISSADPRRTIFKDDLAYLGMQGDDEGDSEYKSSMISTRDKFLQLWDRLESEGDQEVDHTLLAFILFRACSFFGVNSDEVDNRGAKLDHVKIWLCYICGLSEAKLYLPHKNEKLSFLHAYRTSHPPVAVAINDLLPQYLSTKSMGVKQEPTCTEFCKKALPKAGNDVSHSLRFP